MYVCRCFLEPSQLSTYHLCPSGVPAYISLCSSNAATAAVNHPSSEPRSRQLERCQRRSLAYRPFHSPSSVVRQGYILPATPVSRSTLKPWRATTPRAEPALHHRPRPRPPSVPPLRRPPPPPPHLRSSRISTIKPAPPSLIANQPAVTREALCSPLHTYGPEVCRIQWPPSSLRGRSTGKNVRV